MRSLMYIGFKWGYYESTGTPFDLTCKDKSPSIRWMALPVRLHAETGRQTNKRRKRKPSTANDSGGVRGSKRKNQSPGPQLSALGPPGDVMIVGEPTLMGGDFGEEDERLITRLENSQFGSGGPPGDAASQQMRPPPPPRSSSRGGKPNSVPTSVPPSSSGPMGPGSNSSGPPGPPGGILADRRPNSAGCPPGADNPPPASNSGPPSCGVKQEQNSPSGKSTPGRSTTPANNNATGEGLGAGVGTEGKKTLRIFAFSGCRIVSLIF